MGGNSSKSEVDPHTATTQDYRGASNSDTISSETEGVAAGSRVHQGPIHSICPLDHDTLLSGGVDKVSLLVVGKLLRGRIIRMVIFCIECEYLQLETKALQG